jgi:hypothetical protein
MSCYYIFRRRPTKTKERASKTKQINIPERARAASEREAIQKTHATTIIEHSPNRIAIVGPNKNPRASNPAIFVGFTS